MAATAGISPGGNWLEHAFPLEGIMTEQQLRAKETNNYWVENGFDVPGKAKLFVFWLYSRICG
jgi:hypothetical protein